MRTQFILVRHGETDWNKPPIRFRGRADVPLSAAGIAQAQRTAAHLASEPLHVVYSSPLARTMRTAELIAAPHALTPQAAPALLDLDYGAWQGLTHEEVQARDPERYRLWQTAPDQVQFPGGESLSGVRERLMQAIQGWTARHDGQNVLLSSHDAVGKVLLLAILEASLAQWHHLELDNAAVVRVVQQDGVFVLKSFNERPRSD